MTLTGFYSQLIVDIILRRLAHDLGYVERETGCESGFERSRQYFLYEEFAR